MNIEKNKFIKILSNQKLLMAMLLPFIVWFIIYFYVPIYGWIMAFTDYNAGQPLLSSKFVGFKHFLYLFFDSGDFLKIMRNSLVLNILNLILSNVFAIMLVIMLNEVRKLWFKRIIQTVSYLPYLISWVIVSGIFYSLLSVDTGLINNVLLSIGAIKEPIYFLAETKYSWWIMTFANVWKSMGWNSIIYIAAIAGINPEYYDAAAVDGAGRFMRIRHVVLPSILATIGVMFLMSAGWILNTGFEQYYLLGNSLTLDYTDVIDTYTVRYGLQNGLLSYATAVGVFRSVISIAILFIVNSVAKKYTDNSLF